MVNLFGQALIASLQAHPFAYVYGGIADVEIFWADAGNWTDDQDESPSEAGWYYWYCFPGCLPDSDPFGPFATKAEALADMQEQG